jgi:hypothetical protein
MLSISIADHAQHVVTLYQLLPLPAQTEYVEVSHSRTQ